LRKPQPISKKILNKVILDACKSFISNQFAWRDWEFYHVSTPLTILYVSALAAWAIKRDKSSAMLLALILCIYAFYAIVRTEIVADLRNRIRGLPLEFQFDRFYFLLSALTIILWTLASRSANHRVQKTLVIAGILQLTLVFARAPQIAGVAPWVEPQEATPTFSAHFKEADYAQIRSIVGARSTLSIGIDPMIAVTNHISAIDGYYVAYPVTYKHRFRKIIERQLPISGMTSYFDHWGSRVYTFVTDPGSMDIDFCEAQRLGAAYVISRFALTNAHLVAERMADSSSVYLYKITDCAGHR